MIAPPGGSSIARCRKGCGLVLRERGFFMQRIQALAVFILAACAGYGQTALATITGTITDPTAAVVANAPVSVKNLENGQTFTGTSSATGNYTVSQLPIGDYAMTVADR